MIVYHVTGLNKLLRYKNIGKILPPVRAWKNIQEAERQRSPTGLSWAFSKQTGRPIILRLKFPDNVLPLAGHKEAVVSYKSYSIENILGKGEY